MRPEDITAGQPVEVEFIAEDGEFEAMTGWWHSATDDHVVIAMASEECFTVLEAGPWVRRFHWSMILGLAITVELPTGHTADRILNIDTANKFQADRAPGPRCTRHLRSA